MSRLDKDLQAELEPKRMLFAKNCIEKLGYKIFMQDEHKLQFSFKDEIVTLYPYSGWHTGKSITDGRGINKLLTQISQTK